MPTASPSARSPYEPVSAQPDQAVELPGRRVAWTDSVRRPSKPFLYLMAAASAAAGLLHGWVIPEHFPEEWPIRLFFLVVAFAQAAYGAALLDWWHSRPLVTAGIVSNLLLIMLLLAAHIVSLPILLATNALVPHREALGAPELATLLLETILVAALATLWRGRRRGRPGSASR